MYRQGDVLLVPVGLAPYELRRLMPVARKRGEGIILAAGEATGHHHRIRNPWAREFRGTRAFSGSATSTDKRYVRIGKGGATITHEEHDPIPVPEGMYEIVQQREYAPDEVSLSRPVYD